MAKQKTSQIAAQLYTLRDLMGNPKDAAKTLKQINKIGYTNAQISGPICNFDPLETQRMLADAGVTAIGAHIGLDAFRQDLGAVVDKLHAWGCDYVAVPYLAVEERKTQIHWQRRAKELAKIGQSLAKEGIILQYHNHAFEFMKFGGNKGLGGRTGLEILYAESDPKYLQAELDTCWVARGGGDPAAWCLAMKGRMHQVHLKDTVIIDDQPQFAEIGEGNLNWPAILKACKSAGVKMYIIEQDSCPVTKNPLRSLEISYKNLLKMGLE